MILCHGRKYNITGFLGGLKEEKDIMLEGGLIFIERKMVSGIRD